MFHKFFSMLYKCQNTLPRPTFILFPSHFNDSFGKMHRPDTCPTALKSHKSRTPLVHHLVPFYFTVSRPGATDPRAKHQALAPSMPISLPPKSMFVTDLLTFNASARTCGQKRWQTMWNLRTYKAICDTKIEPRPPTKNLKPRSRVKVKVNFHKNQKLLDTCIEFFLWLYKFVRTPSPVPLSSCFHSISMTFLERCTGPAPVQQH